MLIVTRKKGQAIVINDEIKVTFLQRQGNRIQIGVEAPRDVTIYREELLISESDQPETDKKSE